MPETKKSKPPYILAVVLILAIVVIIVYFGFISPDSPINRQQNPRYDVKFELDAITWFCNRTATELVCELHECLEVRDIAENINYCRDIGAGIISYPLFD